MTKIPFTKMVGAGNDFIVVDARHRRFPRLSWRHVSRAWCTRAHGIGADGLLVLESSPVADVRMRIFNPDGSEAEMCGNGARCVALYLKSGTRGEGRGARARGVAIHTKAGVIRATVMGDRIAMQMSRPTELGLGLSLDVEDRAVHLSVVNTGVPHAVVPVETIEEVDVARLGRALRQHAYFAPRGTNVNFIQRDPQRPNRLLIRTYERGVEAETLACGTGVAACAVVSAVSARRDERNGHDVRKPHVFEIQTRSGEVLKVAVTIETQGSRDRVTDVVLEGTASRIFDGIAYWPAASGRRTKGAG